MMKKISALFIIATFAMVLVLPLAVSAQPDLGLNEVGAELDLGDQDIRTTIGQIINAALGFLGVVAIIIVLMGGFKYMVAGGSDEKVQEARKWIISGVIGLAIILSAYAITTFVIEQLVSATTS